jgi:hypothetical protein
LRDLRRLLYLEEHVSGLPKRKWVNSPDRLIFAVDTASKGTTYQKLFGSPGEQPVWPTHVIPLYTRQVRGKPLVITGFDTARLSGALPPIASEVPYALSDWIEISKGRRPEQLSAVLRMLPAIAADESAPGLIRWYHPMEAERAAWPMYRPLITYRTYPQLLSDLLGAAGRRIGFAPFVDAARGIAKFRPGEVPEPIELADIAKRLAPLGLTEQDVVARMGKGLKPWMRHADIPAWARAWQLAKSLASSQFRRGFP